MAGFGLRTKNTHNKVRENKPLRGFDFDSKQISIYAVIILIGIGVLLANISIIWKGIFGGILYFLFLQLPKKFDNNKNQTNNMDYGRTMYEWFILVLKKIFGGSIMVDRGADYTYFKK